MNASWSYQNNDEGIHPPISPGSQTAAKIGHDRCNQDSQISRRGIIVFEETVALLNLAIPTVIIHLGVIFPPFLIASYVGRVLGPVYLGGFQLASLTGNIFTLSVLEGLYSASDTLAPQAFGAGNLRHVGVITIQGFLASLLIMIPINAIIVPSMQPVLIHLGEDSESARQASRWYKIYALSLPFYALYMVTWKFLSAVGARCHVTIGSCLRCELFDLFPSCTDAVHLWLRVCWFCHFSGSFSSVTVWLIAGLSESFLAARI